MSTAEQTVDVNVDVTTAYDQWTRFESFPRWMEGVASVDQIDDTCLHWVAKVKSRARELTSSRSEGPLPRLLGRGPSSDRYSRETITGYS